VNADVPSAFDALVEGLRQLREREEDDSTGKEEPEAPDLSDW
jgi:hypothetical protein